MWQSPAGKEARLDAGAPSYQRHRPEGTLLYRLVDEYYPAFLEQLMVEGKSLPGYVRREFEAYLQCGRLEHPINHLRYPSPMVALGSRGGGVYIFYAPITSTPPT